LRAPPLNARDVKPDEFSPISWDAEAMSETYCLVSNEFDLDLDRLMRERGWLRTLARGLVKENDVDDAVQESWLAALRSRSRPESSLRAWFRGLARNAARKLRRERGEVGLEGGERIDAQPAVGELLAHAELQERLIAAVRGLAEPYRATVLLHYFEDLPLETVGRRTGVPGSTARTRLARALSDLREKLRRELDGSAWALVVRLAHDGGILATTSWMGVGAMTSVTKVGVGIVAAASIALAVWWREEGDRQRAGSTQEEGVALPDAPAKAPAPEGEARSPLPIEGLREPKPLPPLSSASRPEADAPTAAPGNQESPAGWTSSFLTRELDVVAESFRTEDFDAAGLLALSARLAQSARVVPESIMTEEGGKASGRLECGDLVGTYEIEGSRYRIQFEQPYERVPFLFQRDLLITFSGAEQGVENAWASLRFQIRTSGPDHTSVFGSEEHIIGWSLGVSPHRGTTAHPMTVKVVGTEVHSGNVSETIPLRTLSSLRDVGSFESWLSLLRLKRPR
jgi:RNA polymerase sigma-70 factor (ECF subfamily)